MVLLTGMGGCVSAEARAREEDWTGRARRAAHAADDGGIGRRYGTGLDPDGIDRDERPDGL
jgi:hypothetical protein